MSDQTASVIELASEIISAYVRKHAVTPAALPGLIRPVHDALATAGASGVDTAPDKSAPPASIHKSVTPDFLICLVDGRQCKSFKRDRRTAYDLTPEAYRAKWGLAKDSPMVAPNYAASRSSLARKLGLGQGGDSCPSPRPRLRRRSSAAVNRRPKGRAPGRRAPRPYGPAMGFIDILGASGVAYRFRLWTDTGEHAPVAGAYALVALSPRKTLALGLLDDLSRAPKALADRLAGAAIYTRYNVSRQHREAEYADLAEAHPLLCGGGAKSQP